MKRFIGATMMVTTTLLLSAGLGFAQSAGDRSSIGDEKPLSHTVKVDEEQEPAFETKAVNSDQQSIQDLSHGKAEKVDIGDSDERR